MAEDDHTYNEYYPQIFDVIKDAKANGLETTISAVNDILDELPYSGYLLVYPDTAILNQLRSAGHRKEVKVVTKPSK